MEKYKDQRAIREVLRAICCQDSKSQKLIKKNVLKNFKEAQIEVSKITPYTAPEDARNRKQVLYYYNDLIEEMGWTPVKSKKS